MIHWLLYAPAGIPVMTLVATVGVAGALGGLLTVAVALALRLIAALLARRRPPPPRRPILQTKED